MEAVNPASTSSKVIVQCTDPHGLFDKISSDLEARQTLGNLHWKSPTRPLRSIDKLNVSFTRETKDHGSTNANRRHQIPGLRQTPFVKIYLLRCDDKETYKEQSRKDIKQWMKTQGLNLDGKNSGKGQERHDAFEWMILHVVLPNTAASSLPKSAKHISIEATESTDSINSKSKWTGKASSTIFDKLRADFSSSSKVPFERVAQVRIADNTKPNITAANAESQELWNDFIEKLKSAILGSFDTRVAQYEEDIKDRDSQRNLPGWNFCTFFVLKEGLARGFQNGGLLEDALVVYEELDADLDGICRALAESGDPDSAGVLLPFSQDLKAEIRMALESPLANENGQNGSSPNPDLNSWFALERKAFPLDANKVDYQHRILTNQVSALDLRIYIFSRKLNIMYQKASNIASKIGVKSNGEQSSSKFDIGVVADIVEQAAGFINFAARALRQDLYAAWGGQEGLSTAELKTQQVVINNIVASWKVSAIAQTLEESRVSHILTESFQDISEVHGTNFDTKHHFESENFDRHLPESANLVVNGENIHSEPTRRLNSVLDPTSHSNVPEASGPRNHSHERLSLWTGELLIGARDLLANANPSALFKTAISTTTQADNVSHSNSEVVAVQSSGLRSASLQAVSASPKVCEAFYVVFSVHAYHCFVTAGQTQASRQALLNLAQVTSMHDDMISAARWLEKIPNLDKMEVQTVTDYSILTLYTKCLRNQGRTADLSRCLLSILRASSLYFGSSALSGSDVDYQELLDDLMQVADQVNDCEFEAFQLFKIDAVDKCIKQRDSADGFVFTISLELRIPAVLKISEAIMLQLTSAASDDPSDILMTSKHPIIFDTSLVKVDFESHVTTTGWYEIQSISIPLGNMSFTHYFQAGKPEQDNFRQHTSTVPWPILIYPRNGAISVEAKQSPTTDLTRTRHVQVVIRPGDQDINSLTTKIRPGTAGVRLNTSAIKYHPPQDSVVFDISPLESGGCIEITNLGKGRDVLFDVPYTLETSSVETLQLKFEIHYSTERGHFEAYFSQVVDVVLPITVNLQDIFQYDRLFSRFTAAPSTIVPLAITKWQIEDNEVYRTVGDVEADPTVYAFPKLPVGWVVEVLRLDDGMNPNSRLPLLVQYRCLNEHILASIRTKFVDDLRQSRLRFATILLQSHLLSKIPTLWNQSYLEATALLQEISVWTFEQLNWKQVLQGLSRNDRVEGERWLREWHANHTRIDLSEPNSQSAIEDITRTLKLLVDVPQPVVFVCTELKFRPWISKTASKKEYITLGEPIQAELIVSYKNKTRDGGDFEILYDVVSQAEAWIIGGKKRGVLRASQEKTCIPIILMAQRTGHLMYPSVEVRCRRAGDAPSYQDPDKGSDVEDSLSFQYEVENKSQAQSILVISEMQGVTVALGSVMERGMGVGLGRDGYAIVDTRYGNV